MYRRVPAAIVPLLIAYSFAAAQQTSPSPKTNDAPDASLVSSAPLPDIQTVISRVRARALALEGLRKNYICTMTMTADEFSSNGSKKTHTDQYQVFYVGNTEVDQHVARDGKPLSPADAAKEQQRVDKLVAKLKSQQQKPEKDQVVISASGLLKVATFSNPRRELINGRPTLVFDYQGNPSAKADNLGQEVMRRLAGTLWIDERDDALLRFKGTLQENFHVAGGLLINIKKGSWFDSTFAPVHGEIWFPALTTAHVDGRFLLLKGFSGDGRQTFSDYRKLTTSVTILPGTQVLDESQPAPQNAAEPTPSASAPPAAPKL